MWSAILSSVDRPGITGEFVSVADVPRTTFGKHPWSIGGGGASDVKNLLDSSARTVLASRNDSIGFASFTGSDDVFSADPAALIRRGCPAPWVKPFIIGETVRDWGCWPVTAAFAPYDQKFSPAPLDSGSPWAKGLWPCRSTLEGVVSFGGKTRKQCGDPWWTWYRWVPSKYDEPLSITFAFVSTHNHFVLDRGGKVFSRSAPVIKLPAQATENDHLALVGLLNSSTACFWLKQVFHNKGSTVDTKGARQTTDAFENFYEFTGTGLQQFPLVEPHPTDLARQLDTLAQELAECLPAAILGSLPAGSLGSETTDA